MLSRNWAILVTVVLIEVGGIAFLLNSGPSVEVQTAQGYFHRSPSNSSELNASYVIAAVGDSHTAGDFSNASNAWPHQLEKVMEKDAGRELKVLNYGESGAGIRKKVDTISGMNRSPDLLILQLSADPIDTELYSKKVKDYMDRKDLPYRHEKVQEYKNGLRAEMRRESSKRAEEIYRRAYRNITDAINEDTEVLVLHFRSPRERKPWMDDMVEERFGWEYLWWDDFWKDRLPRENILYIDKSNQHYIPVGHRIWAEELAEWLGYNFEEINTKVEKRGFNESNMYDGRYYAGELKSEMNKSIEKSELGIVALGDSLTAGFGLRSRKYAWPELLEQKLNSRDLYKPSVEVVNLGMPARGVEEHAERLASYEGRRKGDLLIVQLNYRDYLDYDELDGIHQKNFSNTQINSREKRKNIYKELWKDYVKENRARPDIYKKERMRKHLDRIEGNATSFRRVIVLNQADRGRWGFSSFLKSYAEEKGWMYLDWTDFWREKATEEEVTFSDDMHYNKYGNLLWTDELVNRLEGEGVIQE